MSTTKPLPLDTDFTRLLGCDYPIICGPMFLVSDPDLVAAVSEAGGIGGMPSLNWRTTDAFREAVREVKRRTSRPFAVNLIVNKANSRVEADLAVCAEEKVPLIVTSLGSPERTIREMHQAGGKVFCDVTTVDYARKVQDLGADGVIAVSAGAGGHAGPISPLVFIPYLRKHLSIPIIAAGGIANGAQIASVMMLGASAVQIGTRFIATTESKVTQSYKDAILNSEPEDIVLTEKISGTPASVIRTPYVDRIGLHMNPLERMLIRNKKTKKLMRSVRYVLGSKMLEKAAAAPTWKEVWAAGQGVGLIEDVKPAGEVVWELMTEYLEAAEKGLPLPRRNDALAGA